MTEQLPATPLNAPLNLVSAESTWPTAVYVHVPFCLHHCGYCDFTLVANRDHLIPEYLRLLTREMQELCREVQQPLDVQTIFLGGGTPTHLSPADLNQLLEILSGYFRLLPGGEFSIEANPDGLCKERLSLLRSRGVNRLSLGVQSFDNSVLKTLERRHDGDMAFEAVARACEYFDNVSLDLIFGVPDQTLESWQATVQTALRLPIQHISTYGLTYESGTPFFRRERSGSLHRVPDVLERDMYLDAISTLTESGFEHYEVSNYARPGFHCRHNEVYWNAEEYFAFGPGAARYLHGVRSTNCRSVVRWLKAWKDGQQCLEDVEQLSAEEKAREAIMLGLRKIGGLDVETLESRFECSLRDLAGDVLDRHIRDGHLTLDESRLKLTRAGLLIADTIVSDFL